MPGSGGKSTERLIEELAAYTNVPPPLFALNPADAFKSDADVSPPFTGYTIASLPPADSVFNGFFVDSRVHMQLEYTREGRAEDAVNDWHIVDSQDDVVSLHCLLTGSTLIVRLFPAELSYKIRSTFSASAIQARTPPERAAPSPEACWTSFCRIVSDLLTTSPSDRKSVPANNATASLRLDLPVVLPYLGFIYNPETDAFDPPRSGSRAEQLWWRRLLLEVLLDLSTFEQRDALTPTLARFFGVSAIFGDTQLSPQAYGCLGCTSMFTDDQVLQRYELQAQNDSANVPWYLEALKQVAQSSQSEAIEMKVLELLSLGTQTLSSLEEAFATIGLDVKSQAKLTDEQLVELVADSPTPGPLLDAASSLRPTPLILRAAAAPNMGLPDALRALSFDYTDIDDVEDATICDRVKRLWNSGPVGKLEARRAVEILGSQRRSGPLLHLLEQYTPLTTPPPSVNEAYASLGVGPDVSDRDIEAIFEANVEDSTTSKLLDLRRSMLAIAEARDSRELRAYLRGSDGDDASPEASTEVEGPRLPVGLWNTGNTCYLNSLLQFYYSLDPVRNFVAEYSDSNAVQADDDSMTKKKVGGRIVPFNEVKRSEIFVEHLASLFAEIQTTRNAHVTPSDLLAYLVLIPPQEDADEIIAANRIRNEEEEAMLRSRLVAALQRQQDVTECIENVLYQLEAATCASGYDDDGEQHDLIKDLFYGTTTQTLQRISDGGNKRTKKERFSSLLVDVSDGPADIYDALDKFFAEDVLDLEDGPTLRTLRVTSLPAILQVQVQRVQFDRETYLPYKSLNPLRFEQTVYLDRYLEAPEGGELDEKVQEVKKWRTELAAAKQQLEAKGEVLQEREALATTLAWLKSSGAEISDSTRDTIQLHYTQLCERLSKLETRQAELEYNIKHQFDAFKSHGYRIHALFIHRGDASYGHYWIYIRDLATGQFYKYNDEFVSKASDEEVFDFREENLATPYFLVFIREDLFTRIQEAAAQHDKRSPTSQAHATPPSQASPAEDSQLSRDSERLTPSGQSAFLLETQADHAGGSSSRAQSESPESQTASMQQAIKLPEAQTQMSTEQEGSLI